LSFSLACLLLLGSGTSPELFAADDSIDTDGGPGPSVGPSQSSSIALSRDDRRLVNVNPDANSVSLFRVRVDDNDADDDDDNRSDMTGSSSADFWAQHSGPIDRDRSRDRLVKIKEIAVGKDPSSVAIHPKRKLAFVSNSFDGTVSVVDLRKRDTVAVIPVGVEPAAVALSPNGTRPYVANSASNSITVLDTSKRKPTLVAEIKLEQFGTAPRAIAITNNGDKKDTDETVFVALFYAQLRAGKTSLEEGQDDQREGRVVAISAANNQVLAAPNPILLQPIADSGFNSNGRLAPGTVVNNVATAAIASTNPQTFTIPTGAFPNQLAAIAIQPSESRATW
jgi:YVTN family beta-propeller protein